MNRSRQGAILECGGDDGLRRNALLDPARQRQYGIVVGVPVCPPITASHCSEAPISK